MRKVFGSSLQSFADILDSRPSVCSAGIDRSVWNVDVESSFCWRKSRRGDIAGCLFGMQPFSICCGISSAVFPNVKFMILVQKASQLT